MAGTETLSASLLNRSNGERSDRIKNSVNIVSVGIKLRTESIEHDDAKRIARLVHMDRNKPLSYYVEQLIVDWNLKEADPNLTTEDFSLAFENLNYITNANRDEIAQGSILFFMPSASRVAAVLVNELRQTTATKGDYATKSACLDKMENASRDYLRAREMISAGVHTLLVDLLNELANDVMFPATAADSAKGMEHALRSGHSRSKTEDSGLNVVSARQTRQDTVIWQTLVLRGFKVFDQLMAHGIIQCAAIDKRLIVATCMLLGQQAVTDEELKLKLLNFLQHQLVQVPSSAAEIESHISLPALLANNISARNSVHDNNSAAALSIRDVKLATLKLIDTLLCLSACPSTYYDILMQPEQRQIILNFLMPLEDGSVGTSASVNNTTAPLLSTNLIAGPASALSATNTPATLSAPNNSTVINTTISSVVGSTGAVGHATGSAGNMRTMRRETKSLTALLGKIQRRILQSHIKRLIPILPNDSDDLVASALQLDADNIPNQIKSTNSLETQSIIRDIWKLISSSDVVFNDLIHRKAAANLIDNDDYGGESLYNLPEDDIHTNDNLAVNKKSDHMKQLLPIVESSLRMEYSTAVSTNNKTDVVMGPLVLNFVHYYAVNRQSEFVRWIVRNQVDDNIMRCEKNLNNSQNNFANECPFFDAAREVAGVLVEAFQLFDNSVLSKTLSANLFSQGEYRRISPIFTSPSMPSAYTGANTALSVFAESPSCHRMLWTHGAPLHELFCILMRACAITWHEMHASVWQNLPENNYNEFRAVMSCVCEKFGHSITKHVATLADFANAMDSLNYTVISALRRQERKKNETMLESTCPAVIELREILQPHMMELVVKSRLAHLRHGTWFGHRFGLTTAVAGGLYKPVNSIGLLSSGFAGGPSASNNHNNSSMSTSPSGGNLLVGGGGDNIIITQQQPFRHITNFPGFYCRLTPLGNFLCFGGAVNQKRVGSGADPTPPAYDELPYRIAVSSLIQLLTGDNVPVGRPKDLTKKSVQSAARSNSTFSIVFRMPVSVGDSSSSADVPNYENVTGSGADNNAVQLDVNVDFTAPTERDYEMWTDGIRALLRQPLQCRSAQNDADMLLALEMKVRLVELVDATGGGREYEVLSKCPPLPKNYNFFY